MSPRVWAWLIIVPFLSMLIFAIVVNIGEGGTFIYRDTFTYDYNGDGVAEERHGATVRAYPLDSPSAYTSTTTDTALTGHNFQLVLDDTYGYYKIKITGYAPNDALAKTEFQLSRRNFVVASGETLDIQGVFLGTSASVDTVYDLLTANKMRIPDSLTVGTVRSSKTISGRGLSVDSLTIATATTMPGLNVTGSRPSMYGIAPADKGTVNLRNPKIVSFLLLGGFHWEYLAAESLWLDGFRCALAPSLDSIASLTGNYMTWDEIREVQNMGHEIWLWGGSASLTPGGPTFWAAYTTAQLDTAISNAKAAFGAQGITLSGFKWPEGDSASFAKYRTTIAKHFDAGIFNTGWNPAHPYGAGISLVDSVSVFNLGDILASYPITWLASAESVIAYYTGENNWILLEIYGSPVPGYAASQCGPDPRHLWQWADSVGIQILPPAQVAKQWYGLGWPTDWNPISNGDFSQDLDNDGRPDGWYCIDDSSGNCGGVTPRVIVYAGSAGPSPEGHKNYALIEPYEWGTTVRGRFTGFEKQRKYAFSFWGRNDSDDDSTSYIRLDIYRYTVATEYVGSDAARWGSIWPTLPNDTLWHKIDYTVDADLIVATGDSLQQVQLWVIGGTDTVYVTGFEAHLYDGDDNPGWLGTASARGFASDSLTAGTYIGGAKAILTGSSGMRGLALDSVTVTTALVPVKNSKALFPATATLKIPAGAAFPASPDSAWLYQKTGSDKDSLCIYDKTHSLWRCF